MGARGVLVLAAVSGMLGVVLGAFGAHGLNDTKYLERKYAEVPEKVVAGLSVPASWKYFRDFETAVDYQLAHTAALLACGLLMLHRSAGHAGGGGRLLSWAANCFAGGIVFFSGSLYVLVIGGPRWLGVPWGMVAPLGGTMLILGWLFLGLWCATLKVSVGSDVSR